VRAGGDVARLARSRPSWRAPSRRDNGPICITLSGQKTHTGYYADLQDGLRLVNGSHDNATRADQPFSPVEAPMGGGRWIGLPPGLDAGGRRRRGRQRTGGTAFYDFLRYRLGRKPADRRKRAAGDLRAEPDLYTKRGGHEFRDASRCLPTARCLRGFR